ncbi:hypothetical protein GCM10020255_005130 [Rhodococcus baikonurensis]
MSPGWNEVSRFEDRRDAECVHDVPDGESWHVDVGFSHPPAHGGVDGQVGGLDKDLAVFGWGKVSGLYRPRCIGG